LSAKHALLKCQNLSVHIGATKNNFFFYKNIIKMNAGTFHEERVIIMPGKNPKKENIEVFKNINGKKTHFKRNNLTMKQGQKLLNIQMEIPNAKFSAFNNFDKFNFNNFDKFNHFDKFNPLSPLTPMLLTTPFFHRRGSSNSLKPFKTFKKKSFKKQKRRHSKLKHPKTKKH
jgi:hypothetical protein